MGLLLSGTDVVFVGGPHSLMCRAVAIAIGAGSNPVVVIQNGKFGPQLSHHIYGYLDIPSVSDVPRHLKDYYCKYLHLI